MMMYRIFRAREKIENIPYENTGHYLMDKLKINVHHFRTYFYFTIFISISSSLLIILLISKQLYDLESTFWEIILIISTIIEIIIMTISIYLRPANCNPIYKKSKKLSFSFTFIYLFFHYLNLILYLLYILILSPNYFIKVADHFYGFLLFGVAEGFRCTGLFTTFAFYYSLRVEIAEHSSLPPPRIQF